MTDNLSDDYKCKEEFEQKISEVIEGKIDKKSIEKGGFFSLNGTCTLRRLWLNIIIFIICLQILLRMNYLMINYLPNYFDFVILVLFCIIISIFHLHLQCLFVQRTRTIGFFPWLLFIPLFTCILILLMLIIPSNQNKTDNKYIDMEIPFLWLFKTFLIILTIIYSITLSYIVIWRFQ